MWHTIYTPIIAFISNRNTQIVNCPSINVFHKYHLKKCPLFREATASGKIKVSKEVMEAIKTGNSKKGDVLGVARIAGIMGIKKT